MAFIQCAVVVLTQSTKRSACIIANTACESLLWFINLSEKMKASFSHVTLLTFLASPLASFQKCICNYIGCICKKWPPNVNGPTLVRRIGLNLSVLWYVLIYWAQNSWWGQGNWRKGDGEDKTRQDKAKCDSNGGHLHARKGEDQVQRPPDLPDRSRMMLACTCCPSCVCSQLTFSLLISELFIIKAIGTSFHFHCQLPTEA